MNYLNIKIIPLIILGSHLIFTQKSYAQTNNFPFEVVLKADSIPGFNGLHSFAYGQRDGKVLLIADGLREFMRANHSMPFQRA